MEMNTMDVLDSVRIRKTMDTETQTELTLAAQDTSNLETQSITFYLYKEYKETYLPRMY